MPRKSDEELTRHQILLFKGDWEELGALYPELGATAVIRTLVRNQVEDARKAAASVARPTIKVPNGRPQ